MILLLLLFGWLILPFVFVMSYYVRRQRQQLVTQLSTQLKIPESKLQICAFLHPYCHAGGGGERVLWMAIKTLQEKYPHVVCYVYTGDLPHTTPEAILAKAKHLFNVELPRPVYFIPLRSRWLVEARFYPFFTLIGQSLGSVFMGMEALFRLAPHIYIDSMGFAFTLTLFRFIARARVAAYVHYPTISTDMIDSVSEGHVAFNNRALFARIPLLRFGKLLYYRIFAWLYGLAGRLGCHLVMCNSSWTQAHIKALWSMASNRIQLLYPPCDVEGLRCMVASRASSKSTTHRSPFLLSVGQFRPEKNHPLQLTVFAKFLDLCKREQATRSSGGAATLRSSNLPKVEDLQLILLGGVRDAEDEARVEQLKAQMQELGLTEENVKFEVNASFDRLCDYLASATVGLHTMRNEHFGIGIVEFLAAGLIPLVHKSGGPRLDIINSETGYLADTEEEYVSGLKDIFTMTTKDVESMRNIGLEQAQRRFSDEKFMLGFEQCMTQLLLPDNSK